MPKTLFLAGTLLVSFLHGASSASNMNKGTIQSSTLLSKQVFAQEPGQQSPICCEQTFGQTTNSGRLRRNGSLRGTRKSLRDGTRKSEGGVLAVSRSLQQSSEEPSNSARVKGARSHTETAETVLELSSDIECDPALTESLSTETIKAVNEVAKDLKPEDPGLVVEIPCPADLHAAMELPGSPLLPEANIEASRIAFIDWLATRAVSVQGVSPQNNRKGRTGWANLTSSQALQIQNAQWLVVPWVASIQQAGFSAPPARVLYIEGIGPGRCTMCTVPQIFG